MDFERRLNKALVGLEEGISYLLRGFLQDVVGVLNEMMAERQQLKDKISSLEKSSESDED